MSIPDEIEVGREKEKIKDILALLFLLVDR